MECERS